MKTTLLNWNSHSIKSWERKSYSTRFAIKNSVHKLGVMYWSALLILNLNKNQPTYPPHPTQPPVYKLFQIYISAENKDIGMKLSGCDPWGSRLDWTYSKLDLTVKHILRIALRWGTVLRPGDYYTTLHYTTLHNITLHYIPRGQTRSSMTSKMILS